MQIVIQPDEVFFDGRDLLKLRESTAFLAGFEKPSRQRDIPMHPSGTRVAMVWDALGLVAYEDRPEQQMSHLYLAFKPADTPEHPQRASSATIQINGGIVTAETTARTLPLKGPTPIVVDDGKHFFYQSEAYTVHFSFKRLPSRRTRDLRVVGCLQDFSFSWRPRPPA